MRQADRTRGNADQGCTDLTAGAFGRMFTQIAPIVGNRTLPNIRGYRIFVDGQFAVGASVTSPPCDPSHHFCIGHSAVLKVGSGHLPIVAGLQKETGGLFRRRYLSVWLVLAG